MMATTEISLPELTLVAITRAMLGAGIALVVAECLDTRQRRAVGWTLTAVGVITTVPLVLDVLGRRTTKTQTSRQAHD
jgi:hypothetical protein